MDPIETPKTSTPPPISAKVIEAHGLPENLEAFGKALNEAYRAGWKDCHTETIRIRKEIQDDLESRRPKTAEKSKDLW